MKDIIVLFFAVVVSVSISGCSGDEEESSPTQVAAKVNGKEITVHQLSQALKSVRSTPENSAMTSQEMSNKVLNVIINQEVILQEATKIKLHRTPDVLSTLEAARREVLINAYMSRVVATKTNVSEADARKYFDANDKMFSNRKVFAYSQALIPAGLKEGEVVIEKIKELNNWDSFIDFLEVENKQFQLSDHIMATEKIGKPLLAPLYSLKEGEVSYLKLSDGLLAIKLTSVVDKPVSFKEVKPLIKQKIASEFKEKTSLDLVKNLREAAVVEYLGSFSSVE